MHYLTWLATRSMILRLSELSSEQMMPLSFPPVYGGYIGTGLVAVAAGNFSAKSISHFASRERGTMSGLDWNSRCWVTFHTLSPINGAPWLGARNRSSGLSACWTWLTRQSPVALLGGEKKAHCSARCFLVIYHGTLHSAIAFEDLAADYPRIWTLKLEIIYDANHQSPSIGIFPTVSRPGQES